MIRGLLYRLPTMLKRVRSAIAFRTRRHDLETPTTSSRARLACVMVNDGVLQTLFDEYTKRRQSLEPNIELGWLLLGRLENDEATVLATLPVTGEGDSGLAHMQWSADAQAVASRMLKQSDRRLQVIGVAHTHPSDMPQPSGGDLVGDSRWLDFLCRQEAVFAIGAANPEAALQEDSAFDSDVRFSWYALAAGDAAYRPLPVIMQNGVDLGARLRPIWSIIETHAAALGRLFRLFANVELDVADDGSDKFLGVRIGLGNAQQRLRLLLTGTGVRYYWEHFGELTLIETTESQLDRAVYLILADAAKESATPARMFADF